MEIGFRLLLIEDDAALRSSLRLAMLDEDFTVVEAGTGREGLARLDPVPDAVLLDLGLPDIDGIEVCRQIRAAVGVPIVIISARTKREHLAAALASGADDYLPKPFAAAELAARVRGLLRPARRPVSDRLLRIAGLHLHSLDDAVSVHGRRVPLTRTEFRLLCELAAEPGRPIPASELLHRVWGQDSAAAMPALEARVVSLDDKLHIGDVSTPRIIDTGSGHQLMT